MKVLVLGCMGNMGRRYTAILDHLGVEHEGIDILSSHMPAKLDFTHVIIATPTDTHLEMLSAYSTTGLKILCEKPLSTDRFDALESTLLTCTTNDTEVYMVNNYEYLTDRIYDDDLHDSTKYNYYNSGKDGLIWDCIQLFRLRKHSIRLEAKDPVWHVAINGSHLCREDVDESYFLMIQDFVKDKMPMQSYKELVDLHKEVSEHHARYIQSDSSEYWCPSTYDEQEVP